MRASIIMPLAQFASLTWTVVAASWRAHGYNARRIIIEATKAIGPFLHAHGHNARGLVIGAAKAIGPFLQVRVPGTQFKVAEVVVTLFSLVLPVGITRHQNKKKRKRIVYELDGYEDDGLIFGVDPQEVLETMAHSMGMRPSTLWMIGTVFGWVMPFLIPYILSRIFGPARTEQRTQEVEESTQPSHQPRPEQSTPRTPTREAPPPRESPAVKAKASPADVFSKLDASPDAKYGYSPITGPLDEARRRDANLYEEYRKATKALQKKPASFADWKAYQDRRKAHQATAGPNLRSAVRKVQLANRFGPTGEINVPKWTGATLPKRVPNGSAPPSAPPSPPDSASPSSSYMASRESSSACTPKRRYLSKTHGAALRQQVLIQRAATKASGLPTGRPVGARSGRGAQGSRVTGPGISPVDGPRPSAHEIRNAQRMHREGGEWVLSLRDGRRPPSKPARRGSGL